MDTVHKRTFQFLVFFSTFSSWILLAQFYCGEILFASALGNLPDKLKMHYFIFLIGGWKLENISNEVIWKWVRICSHEMYVRDEKFSTVKEIRLITYLTISVGWSSHTNQHFPETWKNGSISASQVFIYILICVLLVDKNKSYFVYENCSMYIPQAAFFCFLLWRPGHPGSRRPGSQKERFVGQEKTNLQPWCWVLWCQLSRG